MLSEAEAQSVVGYIKSLWRPRIIACQVLGHLGCMQSLNTLLLQVGWFELDQCV